MKYEVPSPTLPIAALLILPAIFLGSNYVAMRPYALIFCFFIVFGSFFVILFFFFSPFHFLLILLFLSLLVGAILRLLILPFFDPFLRPYLLPIFVFFFFLNILSPAYPYGVSNDIYVVKTPRKFQFGKKSAKVYRSLYSSTEQLQVAL
jgi:hypothetical protein